jgi:tetratricopeptide (TPR) repeat protein
MHLSRIGTLLCLLFAAGNGSAEEPKTVIGPSNVLLADGADALLARDAERGVSLTLKGLNFRTSERDRNSAWANLCAGYVMLEKPDEALAWCNKVIEADDDNWRAYNNRALAHIQLANYEQAAADIERAESIRPNARTLKSVKAMLQNEIDPVHPVVTIDDRRQFPD